MTHLRLRVLTRHLEQLVQERTQLLNQAYHKLERLDKAKTDFINVMSHELRTPLNLVYGYAQILQETSSVLVDEEASNITEGILRGAKRMIEVINHVFDATEVDSNLLRLKKHELSLAAVIKDVCAFFETVWAERHLELELENLSDLPIIQADNNLIYKAFYHLIVNAIKYTPDGGKIIITGQCLSSEPPIVEIRIKDSGIGIDPEQLELIFEKFYQTGRVDLHSSGKSSYKGGGPGLGLAIVKGIIVAHGGRVWAESGGYNEQQFLGSVFYVQLPMG
jgi:signal transduction histidine kinase